MRRLRIEVARMWEWIDGGDEKRWEGGDDEGDDELLWVGC